MIVTVVVCGITYPMLWWMCNRSWKRILAEKIRVSENQTLVRSTALKEQRREPSGALALVSPATLTLCLLVMQNCNRILTSWTFQIFFRLPQQDCLTFPDLCKTTFSTENATPGLFDFFAPPRRTYTASCHVHAPPDPGPYALMHSNMGHCVLRIALTSIACPWARSPRLTGDTNSVSVHEGPRCRTGRAWTWY